MEAYRKLEKAGRLNLHRGSIIERSASDNGWKVSWRPRGSHKAETLSARHIVYCTGPQSDFRKLSDPLVQDLLMQNLLSPDALRLGASTVEDYTALDSSGNRIEGLYAIGSLLKGRLYESVAVPELRGQAASLAANLAKGIGFKNPPQALTNP
jgi:uncharacterized NAD(P)/FAD-binding protein YdhS